MKCPLKFSRYEFEGGEDCIGAECGFFGGVCDMDSAVCVQKRPNGEMPEGDALKKLRQFARNMHGDDFPKECSQLQIIADEINDMIERDYVRRDDYDFTVEMLNCMKAERDEMQARVDELYKSCDVLRDKKLAAEREKSELTEQLEAAHAKNRALKAHISKMQSGRHGWHVKGVELQRQVDELTTQLHASSAERARLRKCLGIATDNAHDFLTLVDESGNVYDRDEGLA